MKALLILLVLVLPIHGVNAQIQNHEAVLDIKSLYDSLEITVLPKDYLKIQSSASISSRLGDRVFYVVCAHIRMYQTTGDKWYIHKAIKMAVEIIRLRRDFKSGSAAPPIWLEQLEGYTSMYQDGNTLMSLAWLVYQLKSDTLLVQLPLPESVKQYFPESLKAVESYQQFANWLSQCVNQSLQWYMQSGFWNPDLGFLQHPSHVFAAPINMQAGMANALMFMNCADINQPYRKEVDQLAANYFKKIEIVDKCTGYTFKTQTMQLTRGEKKCYWWYHNGWRIPRHSPCVTLDFPFHFVSEPDYVGYTEHIEDISHGFLVLLFPLLSYYYDSQTLFTLRDMVLWRNTFLNYIYDGKGNFNNCVNGTNDRGYVGKKLNDFKFTAFSYMMFECFDASDNLVDSSQSVYGIVLDALKSELRNGLGTKDYKMLQGNEFWALAEVYYTLVNRNCVDTRFANRKQDYAQQYLARNTLYISGSLHKTDTAQFILESHTRTNMIAGQQIKLGNGFRVNNGAFLKMYIDENQCGENTFSKRSPSVEQLYKQRRSGTWNPENELASYDKRSDELDYLIVSPNPGKGMIQLYFSLQEDGEIAYRVYDLQGKVVLQMAGEQVYHNREQMASLDLTGITPGVYLCSIYVNGIQKLAQKLVLMD